MSLIKSRNKSNFASLHKVEIIKEVFLTFVPEAINIYLSQLHITEGKSFEKIEITEGKYSVKEKDNGHGNLFNLQAEFTHPKVRLEAEEFLNPYRGKLVRLILTDKNGTSRLTPVGKITIKENVPKNPNYNGYLIQFKTVGEKVSFITLDSMPTPPPPDPSDIELLWNEIYRVDKFCLVTSREGWYSPSFIRTKPNLEFFIKSEINWVETKLAENAIINGAPGGSYEQLAIPSINFLRINETYNIKYHWFILRNMIIEYINIPDDFMPALFTIACKNLTIDITDYLINKFYTISINNPGYTIKLTLYSSGFSSSLQPKIDEMILAGSTVKIVL